METKSKFDNLINLSEKPLQAITTVGKKGLKGLGKIISICIGLALLNLIFFCIGIFRLAAVQYQHILLVYLGLSLLAGIGFVIFTGWRGYQYCLLKTMQEIYHESKQPVQVLCEKVIIQCESVFTNSGKTIGDKNLAQAVHIKNIVEEKYHTLPLLAKKALILLFNKLPLGNFLYHLSQDIAAGNRAAATENLFYKVDEFIENDIFGNNNLKWVFLVLLLNVAIQVVIVWFLIA